MKFDYFVKRIAWIVGSVDQMLVVIAIQVILEIFVRYTYHVLLIVQASQVGDAMFRGNACALKVTAVMLAKLGRMDSFLSKQYAQMSVLIMVYAMNLRESAFVRLLHFSISKTLKRK